MTQKPKIKQESLEKVLGATINMLKYVIQMLEDLKSGKDITMV